MEFRVDTLTYEEYTALRKAVGWREVAEKQARSALERSIHTVTAVEDGRAVGMGRLVGDGVYEILGDVVVEPAYQGRGVGRKIVETLFAQAQKEIPEDGQISVQLIAVQGKEAFYEKLGFKRLPNEWYGAGMRKVLRREK